MTSLLNIEFLKTEKFEKIKQILKYVGIALLLVSLVLCAYTELYSFALVLSFFVAMILCFMDLEDVICLYVFLMPLSCLTLKSGAYVLFRLIIFIILCFKLASTFARKKQNISYFALVSLLLYLIYISLPIVNKSTSFDFLSFAETIVVIMVVLENARGGGNSKLRLKNVAISFCLGLILACVLSIFQDYLSDWKVFLESTLEVNRDTIPRFKAYYYHQNNLAQFSAFALSLVFFLFYKKQISKITFFSLFIPIYIFGYLTVSRAYIIVVAIIILTYFAFLIFADGGFKKNWKIMLSICLIFIAISLILFKITSFYFMRFADNYEFNPSPDDETIYDDKDYTIEDWKLVFLGEKIYNPGRWGLYKIYFYYFSQNPLVILFGRGKNAKFIGKYHSHNFIIDSIYQNGIVGILLYLIVLLALFDFKNIKKHFNKTELSILIIVLPLLTFLFLNTSFTDLWLIMLILAFWDKSLNKTNVDEDFAPATDGEIKNGNELEFEENNGYDAENLQKNS